jgi:hypothetical protein
MSWNLVHRPTGSCWAHDSLPVWVVAYPATLDRATFHQGYIATAKLIHGQHPCEGGVDNRRVGGERGFASLQEAQDATEAAAGQKAGWLA